MAIPLVIDTDTAGDDVFSLLLGLRHPEAELVAITICNGNVPFDQQVENALYTVEIAGRGGEVPVHPGCRKPLLAEWIGAQYVHGADGMSDSGFPRAAQRPDAEHGVDALLRLTAERPNELTILAQAPLTNLAAAVTRDPSLPQRVRRLVIMGGGQGNITPAAEFNFYVDPEAARIVLAAGFDVTLFTWTLTLRRGVLDDARLAAIRALDTPLARFFTQVNRQPLEFDSGLGFGGSTHPDSMACAAILDPSLVLSARECFVDVETRGELTRGYSAIDALGVTGRPPNAAVVEDFDTGRFHELLLSVLR